MNVLITFSGATILGIILRKLKIPGGMMIGSMVFAIFFTNSTFEVELPKNLSFVSQVLAGTCIGAGFTKADFLSIKKILPQIVLIISGLLILNIGIGFTIFLLFNIDLNNALFGTIPGGMTSIPIISLDYGANPLVVTVLQFVRMFVGLAFFPRIVMNYLGMQEISSEKALEKEVNNKLSLSVSKRVLYTFTTIMATVLLVSFSELLGIKISLIVLAILFSAIYSIITNRGYVDVFVYQIAQMFLGVFLGSLVQLDDIVILKDLVLPAIFIAVLYTVGCFILGKIVNRFTSFTAVESFFSSIPAGAADVGLITHELGVFSGNVIVVQVTRVLLVTSVFPIIIGFILSFLK